MALSNTHNLRKFYTLLASTTMSYDEIIHAAGRVQSDKRKSREWFTQQVRRWKRHDFVTTFYEIKKGRRRIEKIQLTQKAMDILGIVASNEIPSPA